MDENISLDDLLEHKDAKIALLDAKLYLRESELTLLREQLKVAVATLVSCLNETHVDCIHGDIEAALKAIEAMEGKK